MSINVRVARAFGTADAVWRRRVLARAAWMRRWRAVTRRLVVRGREAALAKMVVLAVTAAWRRAVMAVLCRQG